MSTRRPELISQTNASVFVSARLAWSLAPPSKKKETSKEALWFQGFHTHTHPASVKPALKIPEMCFIRKLLARKPLVLWAVHWPSTTATNYFILGLDHVRWQWRSVLPLCGRCFAWPMCCGAHSLCPLCPWLSPSSLRLACQEWKEPRNETRHAFIVAWSNVIPNMRGTRSAGS